MASVGTRTTLLGGRATQVRDTPLRAGFWDLVDAGTWERATLAAIDQLVDGSVYVDVGAWIGPTVIAAARRAQLVVAYEPDPVAAEELRANVRLNDLQNVVVHEVALFDRDGSVSLSTGFGGSLGWSTSSLVFGRPGSGVEVAVRDARDEAHSDAFQQCSMLKIDVEGAEFVLIGRLRQYLRSRRPTLLLSLHAGRWRKQEHPRFARSLVLLIRRLRNAARRATVVWRTRHYHHAYLEDASGWNHLSRRQRWGLIAYMRGQELLLTDLQFPSK